MRFIVSSAALLKQLQMVGSVIGSSNAIPIVVNFHFDIQEGKLVITGTDMETTLISELNIEAEGLGKACVPSRLLMDILKTLPDHPITLNFGDDFSGADGQLEIVSDYGRYELSFLSADEYPNIEPLTDESHTLIPAGILTTAIQKTLFAAGVDDMRPTMTGVFFQLTSDGLTVVATDAHKLVQYKHNEITSAETAEFILPKKPLNILKNILANSVEEIKVSYNTKNCQFDFEGVTLICRMIDGRYPNYMAVIPQNNKAKLVISRELFMQSLRRVGLFANKTTAQVKMSLAGAEVHLSAEDLDFANSASERLSCDYDGSDMEIGFSSKFLAEMLSNLEGENITMMLSSPNHAGLLHQTEALDEGESVLMLVMPVMVAY